jgi:aspartate racemase
MKTIGLIGGVSWVSTAEYYKRINIHISQKLGGLHSAKILLSSLNFEDIFVYQKNGDNESEKFFLLSNAQKLESAGADVILICSNTTNKTANEIKENLNIPLINIVESIAKKITKLKLKKVALLGTKYVMYGTFFSNILKNYGINTIVPETQDGLKIHDIIYEELVKNIFLDESSDFILKVINRMAHKDVDAVILGCTELPLAVHQQPKDVLIIDSIDAHIEALFETI